MSHAVINVKPWSHFDTHGLHLVRRRGVMSRHLVTVCVVCVLCTTHAPCAAHGDVSSGQLILEAPKDLGEMLGVEDRLHPLSTELSGFKGTNGADRIGDITKRIPSRRKQESNEDEEAYLAKKIFEEYGNGDSMTVEGFDRLLTRLGLCHLLRDNSDSRYGEIALSTAYHDYKDERGLGSSDGSAEFQEEKVYDVRLKSNCLPRNSLLRTLFDSNSETHVDNTIGPKLFERICPALVYQLAEESNSNVSGDASVRERRDAGNNHEIKANKTQSVSNEMKSNKTWQVWIYSSTSILIISLCGLLGVAVIPVMSKSYYHQLLQFLVALAVGTLCGDAFIHLLPHAMMPSGHSHANDHSHDHDDHEKREEGPDLHETNMYKGLVAMLGLVLFFFTEKGLTLIAEWRKSRQRKHNKIPQRVKVMRDPEMTTENNTVGEKLCKHKYSSYPYCYDEITTQTQDHGHDRLQNDQHKPPAIEEEKPLTSDCNAARKDVYDKPSEMHRDGLWAGNPPVLEVGTKLPRLDDENDDDNTVVVATTGPSAIEGESYTVIIREHQTKHHGHTHSHGHVHSAPNSMSSVAWMVIMGDGLHNFTDGMAIGAAFAEDIVGGFSTALAVFCHELPHELGDFAVLLKAGMSARQAVFYNLLSSILCIFGMVFGILLGTSPDTLGWIFAAAAGMFIYIALVDMIPELTSSHSAEGGSTLQCVLQACGLATGLGIMLVIARYEKELKQVFDKE